jgi:hypothetical protein
MPPGVVYQDAKPRMLIDPAERIRFGIDPKDVRPAQVDATGKLNFPGSGGVNVNMQAETAEQKGRGEGLSKRLNAIADGSVAANDLVQIRRMNSLMSSVTPGAHTALLETIRSATGVALDPNAGKVQSATAMLNYLAPRMRVSGAGASSDLDVKKMTNSLPSLMGTRSCPEKESKEEKGKRQAAITRR